MTTTVSRREVLAGAGAILAGTAACAATRKAAAKAKGQPFGYCLNTSTIRGQRLGLAREVEVAAEAGYGAIEPWIGAIRKYQRSGGSLRDLRKKISDLGLRVPSAIGFARWVVNDKAQREKGLGQAKTDMDLVRQIGGTGIAAPPAGVRRGERIDLLAAADRYRVLLELGEQMGVAPQLEIWGMSPTLSRIGQAAMVAIESGHPNACLLLDVFHIYRGGSDFAGLKLFGPRAMHAFHMNDYPADPPRESIKDSHRVFPGDGVAPMTVILRTLHEIGFNGWLSLELFNREYYKRPALEVAKTGLAKMQAAARKALALASARRPQRRSVARR